MFGLWPVAAAPALRQAIVEEEIRKVDRFSARYRVATVAFDDATDDPFFNINAPDDLDEAERLWLRSRP